jgi:aminoglycoside 3-N-acetyltransferase
VQSLSAAARSVLPGPIKAWLKGVRVTYVRVWHSFGPADLRNGLARLGVAPGDTLMVHSSFDGFLGFRGAPADVIRALQDAVGPEGTILMPTLPFSGTVVDYAATQPLFDVRRTFSQVGLITEVFRRSPQVIRSLHPTHSVAAWGAKAGAFIANHELAATPCGPATPWGRLLDYDAKVLLLNVPGRTMTFFHTIEEALEPVLPIPVFEPGEHALRYRDERGVTRVATMRLFSLRLAQQRDLGPLWRELERRQLLREARVGRSRLTLVRARDAFDVGTALAKRGVYCLRP